MDNKLFEYLMVTDQLDDNFGLKDDTDDEEDMDEDDDEEEEDE